MFSFQAFLRFSAAFLMFVSCHATFAQNFWPPGRNYAPGVERPNIRPTLSTPANNKNNWLFNIFESEQNNSTAARETFSWKMMPNAIAYEFVISGKKDFSDILAPNSKSSLPICVDTTDESKCKVIRINLLANISSFNFPSFPGPLFNIVSIGAEHGGWRVGNHFVWQAGSYYWSVRAVYASTSVRGAETKSEWANPRNFSTTSLVDMNKLRNNIDSPLTLRPSSSDKWQWDFSGGDEQRHLNAMNIYWEARRRQDWLKRIKTTRLNMQTAFKGSNYTSATVEKIIARIENKYDASNKPAVSILEYRAQCKEFADRSIQAAGGTQKTYADKTSGFNARPYMYAFFGYSSHAAVVTGVRFTSNGYPEIRITESNMGDGWSNPNGQIAWLRTIQHTRWVSKLRATRPSEKSSEGAYGPARVVSSS